MLGPNIQYFKKGFTLTNKSLAVFLFGLLLSLLNSLTELSLKPFSIEIPWVAGFLISLIEFGFALSVPLYLVKKQEGKSLSLGDFLSTTLISTKRSALPIMFLMVIFITISVLIFILAAQFIYGGNFDFIHDNPQVFGVFNLLLAFFIGLTSFATFTSIYFSVERNGFFASVKKSVSLSIKNLDFIIILFIISTFTYLTLSSFLNNYQNFWQNLVKSIIYQYEGLLIASTSLIFYQSRK